MRALSILTIIAVTATVLAMPHPPALENRGTDENEVVVASEKYV